jgi:flagellar motor switch protein FliN/FliY
MNLEKLLQLQPGNVLDLNVRPEQGVSVTLNGKRVARAELVKLGDVLGIKILHLGE